jgi:3-keto-5-aminohexanoate cleavage enzyme
MTPRELQRRPRELYVPQLPPGAPPSAEPVVTPPGDIHGSRTLDAVGAQASEIILTTTLSLREGKATVEELCDDAAHCREAGAAVLHLRAVHSDGTLALPKERLREAVTKIRAKTDCVVHLSLGGVMWMRSQIPTGTLPVEGRSAVLECRPDLASLYCGSVNLGSEVVVQPRAKLHELAQRLRSAGIIPELECHEVGHVEEALVLSEQGALTKPLFFNFVLGTPGGMAAKEQNLRSLVGPVPPSAMWAVAASPSSSPQALLELAIRLGGHVRAGHRDEAIRAGAYARSIGRTPVDPSRARAMLGTRAAQSSVSP